MAVFLTVVLLIYGAMHAYLLAKVWALAPTWLFGVALAVAGLMLTVLPVVVWAIEHRGWHSVTRVLAWTSYTWMGYLFLFVCVGLVYDLAHAAIGLTSASWPYNARQDLGAIALIALGLLGYGFYEAWQIRVERVEIVTPKLRSGSVTLLQLSDLHLGAMHGEALLRRILQPMRELRPDLVVATGDVVDGQGDHLAALAPLLRSYVPPRGAYAVTGNHETYAGLDNALRFLRDAGFVVLRGDARPVGGLVVAGVDDPSASDERDVARVSAALAPLPSEAFVVLLKHQPVADDALPFDLQLSGHVHGGQIFPFVYLTRAAYRLHTGLTRLADGRHVYVSRGGGTWGPPIRVFAPPEITLITIRAGPH